MISYKLAKELKDAGFESKGPTFVCKEGEEDCKVIPTLEELIEACGEDLCSLESYASGWEASNTYPDCRDEEHILTKGKTPSEAVAKLWLELNKK